MRSVCAEFHVDVPDFTEAAELSPQEFRELWHVAGQSTLGLDADRNAAGRLGGGSSTTCAGPSD